MRMLLLLLASALRILLKRRRGGYAIGTLEREVHGWSKRFTETAVKSNKQKGDLYLNRPGVKYNPFFQQKRK